MRKLALLCCLLLTVVSCKKTNTPTYHGNVKNGTSKSVYFNLYKTLDDYNAGTNAAFSAIIEPKGVLGIPESLETGANFYLDWYSEDFLYSNWGGASIRFNIAAVNSKTETVMTLSPMVNYARKVILNGTSGSYWAAVYALNGNWGTMTDDERYRQLQFNKDKTGVFFYKKNGVVIQKDFQYGISSGGGSNVFVSLQFDDFSSVSLQNYDGIGNEYTMDTITNFISSIGEFNYQYYFKKQP